MIPRALFSANAVEVANLNIVVNFLHPRNQALLPFLPLALLLFAFPVFFPRALLQSLPLPCVGFLALLPCPRASAAAAATAALLLLLLLLLLPRARYAALTFLSMFFTLHPINTAPIMYSPAVTAGCCPSTAVNINDGVLSTTTSLSSPSCCAPAPSPLLRSTFFLTLSRLSSFNRVPKNPESSLTSSTGLSLFWHRALLLEERAAGVKCSGGGKGCGVNWNNSGPQRNRTY